MGLEFEILTADRVERVNIRHLDKFRGDGGQTVNDIAILRFQDGGRPPS